MEARFIRYLPGHVPAHLLMQVPHRPGRQQKKIAFAHLAKFDRLLVMAVFLALSLAFLAG